LFGNNDQDSVTITTGAGDDTITGSERGDEIHTGVVQIPLILELVMIQSMK